MRAGWPAWGFPLPGAGPGGAGSEWCRGYLHDLDELQEQPLPVLCLFLKHDYRPDPVPTKERTVAEPISSFRLLGGPVQGDADTSSSWPRAPRRPRAHASHMPTPAECPHRPCTHASHAPTRPRAPRWPRAQGLRGAKRGPCLCSRGAHVIPDRQEATKTSGGQWVPTTGMGTRPGPRQLWRVKEELSHRVLTRAALRPAAPRVKRPPGRTRRGHLSQPQGQPEPRASRTRGPAVVSQWPLPITCRKCQSALPLLLQ